MAIYGRFGDTVTIKRYATLEDVKRVDGRRPDTQDRVAVAHGAYVIVEQDDGKERLYHQAFLRADGGSVEIGKVLDALPVQPCT